MCNDIHGLPVGGHDIRNSSNSFALQCQDFSSEVGELELFSFDLSSKLALKQSCTECGIYKTKSR